MNLLRSESTKLFTNVSTWIIASVAVLATWPMALTNAGASNLPVDDPRLFSSEPIPLEFQGFEMAGFGYVLVVVLAALWAGNEYGSGMQIRTTLTATPKRGQLFLTKALLLAINVGIIGFITMTGTIIITHIASNSGLDPWGLSPEIWKHLGGVTLAWTLTALITFAIGSLARTAILPLLLITPLVIGIGDFLASLWDGAKYLPVAAGASMYSDPAAGTYLTPLTGGIVQGLWALVLLGIAYMAFCRRDA
ncbi:ABC transporter permease [Glutamicibacter ardleyensis]|uniref:ABC transporter permease n=1 Tax=Glutamicibacter ardleyensis TaxID=225894 RepID=UPI003FD5826C